MESFWEGYSVWGDEVRAEKRKDGPEESGQPARGRGKEARKGGAPAWGKESVPALGGAEEEKGEIPWVDRNQGRRGWCQSIECFPLSFFPAEKIRKPSMR